MMLKPTRLTSLLHAGVALLVAVVPLHAEPLQVTIENLQPADGFFFTPVSLALHDGGFDLFDVGSAASAALETLAETGNPGPLGDLLAMDNNGDGTARFGAVIAAPIGFPGAPVFEPGESVTQMIDVMDPASNRYLTLASMIIPSNDAFVGNSDPMEYTVFNADGSFAGPLTIEIFGRDVYDAGTEVNDGMGAAFSATGGTATDEGSVVELHAGLDNFLGTGTVAGTTIGTALAADSPIARIVIRAVPEPSSVMLTLLGAVGVLRLRRRQPGK